MVMPNMSVNNKEAKKSPTHTYDVSDEKACNIEFPAKRQAEETTVYGSPELRGGEQRLGMATKLK
jgi:hypothetical protein